MTNCRCGADVTSLNPAEVVVHREDEPCYIAPIEAEGKAHGEGDQ